MESKELFCGLSSPVTGCVTLKSLSHCTSFLCLYNEYNENWLLYRDKWECMWRCFLNFPVLWKGEMLEVPILDGVSISPIYKCFQGKGHSNNRCHYLLTVCKVLPSHLNYFGNNLCFMSWVDLSMFSYDNPVALTLWSCTPCTLPL